ncbi:MAG: sortase B protein-sorting domain-containing protein, partial [Coprobacillus sp.]
FGYSLWEFEVYGLSIRTQLKSLYDQNANIDLTTYTPNSVTAFKDALDKGIKVYQNDEVSLKEITDAITLIETAKDGLTKKADKANLIGLLNQANQLKQSDYTEISYKEVLVAKQKAQEVIDNQNASNADVVTVYNLLKQAIDSLVVKPNIDIVPEEPKDNIVIKDSKNNITIVGQLPKGVQLKTKAYTEKQVQDIIEKIKKQNSQFLDSASLERVFDINLLLKDQKYNFDGTIQIVMKVDKELKGKNIGIVYIDDQGNVVKLKSKTDKEYITFDVSHLSTYAIVSYDDINDEGVAEVGKVEVPKTNDDSYIYLYATLATVSLVCLLFRKRKKLAKK